MTGNAAKIAQTKTRHVGRDGAASKSFSCRHDGHYRTLIRMIPAALSAAIERLAQHPTDVTPKPQTE
jgi:hypothetical protein